MEPLRIQTNDTRTTIQIISLAIVIGLLILTAVGSAELMFSASLIAILVLFVWFLAERKVWLATISGLAFLATVLLTAKSLF